METLDSRLLADCCSDEQLLRQLAEALPEDPFLVVLREDTALLRSYEGRGASLFATGKTF